LRILVSFEGLGAATVLTLLVGCSGASAIAPKPPTPQSDANPMTGSAPIGETSAGIFRLGRASGRHFKGFNACPTKGEIVYISDESNNVVNIYTVPFAGQGPCGQIVSDLDFPQGLFVDKNHDLYVANERQQDVLVFHRGASTAFNRYSDPTGELVQDVTVANDGTVIASNQTTSDPPHHGTISTWIRGPVGGTFVDTYPMVNSGGGGYVTVQRNGTMFYNGIDLYSLQGLLWTGKCPLGHCGGFTSTGAKTHGPGGLRSVDDEDIVQVDTGLEKLITYELFPTGMSCDLGAGSYPITQDFNRLQHHVFVADFGFSEGSELSYPGCVLIGTVPVNGGGAPIGIAHDPPDPL
jgi:hypothetical protein